jgi:hypothetical protein
MIEKIISNLNLPKLTETIYINDVATEEEMEEAKRTRIIEGKHVIPVPTFEIKKDFSRIYIGPASNFQVKRKGRKTIYRRKVNNKTYF